MRKLLQSVSIVGLICLVSQTTYAQESPLGPDILGPEAAACSRIADGPSVLVRVYGFKNRAGNVRVELYPATQEDFLASRAKLTSEGKLFKRFDVRTPESGDVRICVAVPEDGEYSLSVLHDRNASGKLDVFSDGYGFPNNPRLGMSKPSVDKATFTVSGKAKLDIVLNYFSGFSAKPIKKYR